MVIKFASTQETLRHRDLFPYTNNLPAETTTTYFRSQTFLAEFGINPLITAAEPILSLVNKLRYLPDYADIYQLHERLAHEIRAFEIRAQQHYRAETIHVARYLLCAFCDEIILHSPWGNESNWGNYRMLLLFQQEMNADEKFFVILHKLRETPSVYIDILELFYLCISLGYLGKFRQLDDSITRIHHLLDELYHVIRLQRGEFNKTLSAALPTTMPIMTNHMGIRPWHIWLFTLFIITAIYLGFNHLITIAAQPAAQKMTQLMNSTKPAFHSLHQAG